MRFIATLIASLAIVASAGAQPVEPDPAWYQQAYQQQLQENEALRGQLRETTGALRQVSGQLDLYRQQNGYRIQRCETHLSALQAIVDGQAALIKRLRARYQRARATVINLRMAKGFGGWQKLHR